MKQYYAFNVKMNRILLVENTTQLGVLVYSGGIELISEFEPKLFEYSDGLLGKARRLLKQGYYGCKFVEIHTKPVLDLDSRKIYNYLWLQFADGRADKTVYKVWTEGSYTNRHSICHINTKVKIVGQGEFDIGLFNEVIFNMEKRND